MTILFLLVFAWLAYWTWLAVKRMAAGNSPSLWCAFPIHFIFCGVPLLLEAIFGIPEFSNLPGYLEACSDQFTAVVYCIYVAACPVLWWAFCSTPKRFNIPSTPMSSFHGSRVTFDDLITIALPIAICLPYLALIAAPDPTIYMHYNVLDRGIHHLDREREYHVLISKLAQLSCLAAAFHLMRTNNMKRSLLLLIPVLLGVFWLHGKRNIVLLGAAVILFTLWKRGLIVRKRVYYVGACAAVILLSYSIYYQSRLRFSETYVSKRSFDFWLENYRIDYGRDLVTRLQIYSYFHPNELPICDYFGQATLGTMAIVIPRRFWPDKPDSYGVYITTAAMGRPSPGGGTITTSVLAEAIEHFGFLGFLIGPLSVVFIARTGDKCPNGIANILTVFAIALIQIVQVSMWLIPGVAWLSVVIFYALTSNVDSSVRHRRPALLER